MVALYVRCGTGGIELHQSFKHGRAFPEPFFCLFVLFNKKSCKGLEGLARIGEGKQGNCSNVSSFGSDFF